MPKSKRDKKVSLTKTQKKGLPLKQKIIEDVRSCAEKYSSVYVFTYNNFRTNKMKQVRDNFKTSRFFIGKNKIIGVALGRTPEDEVQDGIFKISKCLTGQCGVLFTDQSKDEIVEWFKNFSQDEYARAGFKATMKVKLNEGPMSQFAHSIEPYLRQIGMPTKLDKGVVTLIKDFTICKKGDILTPEQAKILELLGTQMAKFHFVLKCCWIKDCGFKKIKQEQVEENVVEEDDEEEEEKENDAEDVDMDD